MIEYQSNPLYDLEKFKAIRALKDRHISEHPKDTIVKKHVYYTDKDYEEMTMRHLPPKHWKEGLE